MDKPRLDVMVSRHCKINPLKSPVWTKIFYRSRLEARLLNYIPPTSNTTLSNIDIRENEKRTTLKRSGNKQDERSLRFRGRWFVMNQESKGSFFDFIQVKYRSSYLCKAVDCRFRKSARYFRAQLLKASI